MRNPDRETTFRFKQFEVSNCRSAMKVGTDGVLLGAWMGESLTDDDSFVPRRVLDVGCGTGVISLMAAQRWEEAEIIGVEIDPVATDEASGNFDASPWSSRLKAVNADFLDFPAESGLLAGGFDLIASNPPFFTNGALAPDEARKSARHEISLTVKDLLRRASQLLNDGGRIALVTPADREKDVVFASAMARLSVSRITRVATVTGKAPKRVLWEFVKAGNMAERSPDNLLTIKNRNGEATEEYARLVSPFYIKF